MKTQKELELEAKAKADADAAAAAETAKANPDANEPAEVEAIVAKTKEVRLLKVRPYPAIDNPFIVYEVPVGTVETLPIELADELIAAGAAEATTASVEDADQA
jgi:hypothetical protein